MNFVIPQDIVDQMISEARQSNPSECCGVLLGNDNKVSALRPIANIHSDTHDRYQMDPVQLTRVLKSADRNKLTPIAFYHSHTYTVSYPSQTDIRNAVDSGWLDQYYVIVSIKDPDEPSVKAYKLAYPNIVREHPILTPPNK